MNIFNKWTSIDYSVLGRYLAHAQLNALINHDASNHGNKLAVEGIIQDIIARVRSELVYLTPLPSDIGLIPEELKYSTCHLIIEALFSRIPSLRLSQDQIRNAEKAREHIRNLVQMQLKGANSSKTLHGRCNSLNSIIGKSRSKQFKSDDLNGF